MQFQGFALYQVLTTLFCVIMIVKGISRFKRNERTVKELIVWIIIWGGIGLFSFYPAIIDMVARFFGVKSGAVGFLAIWLIFLTYALFRTFFVVENMEKKLIELARKVALREKTKDSQD